MTDDERREAEMRLRQLQNTPRYRSTNRDT